jgi:hypothetical protein
MVINMIGGGMVCPVIKRVKIKEENLALLSFEGRCFFVFIFLFCYYFFLMGFFNYFLLLLFFFFCINKKTYCYFN